jgi:hypothetical protein
MVSIDGRAKEAFAQKDFGISHFSRFHVGGTAFFLV